MKAKKNDYNGHFVYKYVYNGDIIYVGKTDANLANRLAQHGKKGDNIPETAWDEINASEIYFCKLQSAKQCDIYESELIRRHKPKYNKAKTNEWDGVNIPEPFWKSYNKQANIENEYNKLVLKYNKLRGEYATLKSLYTSQSAAIEENIRLQNANAILASEISNMEKKYNDLLYQDRETIQLKQCKDAYNILQSKYNEILKENFILKNGGLSA